MSEQPLRSDVTATAGIRRIVRDLVKAERERDEALEALASTEAERDKAVRTWRHFYHEAAAERNGALATLARVAALIDPWARDGEDVFASELRAALEGP